MAKDRSTKAEPVTVDALKTARSYLQSAVANLDKLIEGMERAKLRTVLLRFKTRQESSRDWHLFSKGLEQSLEAEIMRESAEQEGQDAKNRDRRNGGK